MKSRFLFVLVGSLIAGPVAAQGVSSQCPPGSVTAGIPDNAAAVQDACQKAIDVFQYLAPQLGTIIAGGNATIGQAGTLGGLGHVMVSARATLLSADIPRVDQVPVSVTGARSDRYPTQSQLAGVPQADASIGLFRGLPLGVTNVGGVDLLVSAAYLPSFNASGVNVKVRGSPLRFGVGARVGLLQESLLFPGVSVTYLRRSLPTVDVRAATGSDTLRVDDIDVTTDSWRVVAGKSFLAFGLAAGVGQDRYDTDAMASAFASGGIVGGSRSAQVALEQKITRTTYFVDGSINFPFVRLIGEIGHTNDVGGIATYNTFDGPAPGAGRLFGALGVRFGI